MNKAVWIMLVALILAGCGTIGQSPQALPTVVLDPGGAPPSGQDSAPLIQAGAEVIASGLVIPARQVHIASAQGGNVESVLVSAGEQVRAGQVLVRMAGAERLAAAVEAAQTELLAARQDLRKIEENAGQVRAEALLRLANANKALDDAAKVRG